jgi:hypothetical protein
VQPENQVVKKSQIDFILLSESCNFYGRTSCRGKVLHTLDHVGDASAQGGRASHKRMAVPHFNGHLPQLVRPLLQA